MKFSIIIPVKEINDYVRESIPYILHQSYEDFEIIILPNQGKEDFHDKRVRIIETGNIGPAQKRDFALTKAKGEILAFIDDDAYPEKNWLKRVLKNFENKEVGAVGGPNLTPKDNNKFQKASGFALSTAFVSGSEGHRYKISKRKEIEDFPSCNLFVRKDVFRKIGGFGSEFWPGEDTKLCLEIINLGKKIIYDPEVIVFHHRRKNLTGYLKQIFSYSLHRGYFAKKLPGNSLRLKYFVPTFFVLGVFFGFLFALLHKVLFIAYVVVWAIYFFLIFLISLNGRIKGFSFFRTAYIIFLTHTIYGLGFIKGLFKKELKSKFR